MHSQAFNSLSDSHLSNAIEKNVNEEFKLSIPYRILTSNMLSMLG